MLVDGPVNDERTDAIRHQLYEVEWECDEVLSTIVRNRQDWNGLPYRVMPFYQQVERDGIVL